MSGGGESYDDLHSLEASASSEGPHDSFDDLLAAAVRPTDSSNLAGSHPGQFARLSTGTKVSGRFVVEWYAGGGGMGDLYRCRDLTTQDVVALKVIRRAGDQGRFRREAAILASLSHHAIVRYITHGETEAGTPYLAMDWLDGEDLARRLRRNHMAVADTLAVARRVCGALAVAHGRGFIHRDLKPSNVFLCGGRAQDAKLIDFGVAHRGTSAQTATRAGTVLGTVGYMAPEQASGVVGTDERDDLFSLGCVLFECLTGRPAFSGANTVAVLEAVLHGEPPDIHALQPDVPSELAALVRRLLRKSRADRPPSAARVAEAFENLEVIQHSQVRTRTGRAPLVGAASPRAHVTARPQTCTRAQLDELALHFDALSYREEDRQTMILEPRALGLTDLASKARRLANTLAETCTDVHIEMAVDTPAGAGAPEDLTPSLCALRAPLEVSGDDFLGRELELATLHAIFAESASDEVARTVLITGASGLGKSALAARFLHQSRNATRLVVEAVPEENALDGSLLRKLQRARASELPLPELLREATRDSPLILCIDDLQWSDLFSMRVLAAAVAQLADCPLFVLGLARSQLPAGLRTLWLQTGTHHLQLRGPNLRACQRIAARQGEPRPELIALAHANPRLFQALAHAPRATALGLVQEQLMELADEQRELLCAASLLGPTWRASELAALVQTSLVAEHELPALRELGLIVQLEGPPAQSDPVYGFALPTIHDAAAQLVDPCARELRKVAP
ncbi:MAG: serine/threonine-protein kinase [Polyangiales bacterium]